MSDKGALDLESATIMYSPHGRAGHGVRFELSGVKSEKFVLSAKQNPKLLASRVSINIIGGIWHAMPSGLGTIAQWLLPMKLRDTFPNLLRNVSEFELSIGIGEGKLSHSTLDARINDVIEKGDPVFMVELLYGADSLLCRFPTRCSLIKAALKQQGPEKKPTGKKRVSTLSSIVFAGDLPNALLVRQTQGVVFKWIRWWFLALLFTALSWGVLLNPFPLLARTPMLLNELTNRTTLTEVLPPHPQHMSEAWDLSNLASKLTQVTSNSGGDASAAAQAILSEAAQIVGRKQPLSPAELHGIRDRILEVEAHVGIVARVTGFMTFVNTMWLVAILGITVSIGPSVYHLLEPLRELFHRCWRWFLESILIPTIDRMHRWRVFELGAYAFCWILVATGVALQPFQYGARDTDMAGGLFISLTGLLLLVPTFMYSSSFPSCRSAAKSVSEKTLLRLVQAWLALSWAPLAVHFQSTLLGYMVVLAVYAVLGFSGACFGLCWCIGFESKVSSHQLQQLTQVYAITDCCLPLSALGS
jgi:hypothetical protein